ncbi:MAG: hypothetical protein A6F71_10155 [Cycloclasticus sp. symbiont of Poecilosclerida sp. M]|nr:MAG: hypothetical protein A6F71_10155 [Cycloclasticus sp. symbiont of Poecilosclerida sp. M]
MMASGKGKVESRVKGKNFPKNQLTGKGLRLRAYQRGSGTVQVVGHYLNAKGVQRDQEMNWKTSTVIINIITQEIIN